MTSPTEKPFYVGYLPTPPGLKLFLLGVSAVLIGMFAGLAVIIGAGQDNPGEGSFRWDWGAQTVTGIVELKPYPVLHVTKGSQKIPTGKSLLLSAGGKNGMQKRLAKFDGKSVSLKGIALQRGDIDAMQVGGGKDSIKVAAGNVEKIDVKPLGRWRLKGEICDGKCLAGAMRPSRGLAHRACANLCLIGGVPPVFVSSGQVDGSEFFLLANKDGEPLPNKYLQHVAVYVQLDGDVERRGRMLIFKVDLDSLKVL
ncbi:MAG: hypothetical protein AAGD43_35635 [Pseudomonadota bacterium]